MQNNTGGYEERSSSGFTYRNPGTVSFTMSPGGVTTVAMSGPDYYIMSYLTRFRVQVSDGVVRIDAASIMEKAGSST